MAQVLKEHVLERITEAALRVIAGKGYPAATMAEIGAAAGVSTGNVYRYFENKEVLFSHAVPPDFARRLSSLVRARVDALRGVPDVRAPAAARWRAVSEELLAFAIANRLRVVILLAPGKAAGTEHEGFAERTAHELAKLALTHARSVRSGFDLTPAGRFALGRIYRSFIETMSAILMEHDDEAAIRAAVSRFSDYHLAGMKAFIEEG